MRTTLEEADIDAIAQRVADILRPLLAQKEAPDTIFSVDELAEYLRVSNKWVYDHAYELPKFKVGGLLRFRKKKIDKYIELNERKIIS